jgi:hypothetical protein
VSSSVPAVPAERVNREIDPIGVVLERVGSTSSTSAVIGEVFVEVEGEMGVLVMLFKTGRQIGEAEEFGRGTKSWELSGESVLGGEFRKRCQIDRAQWRGFGEEKSRLW